MSAPPAPSPERISAREFAKRDGCDEKLVRRGIEEGRLTRGADRKLDARDVGTAWREGNAKTAAAAEAEMRTIVSAPELGAPAEDQAERDARANPAPGRVSTLGLALARKEAANADLRELELSEKQGKVVDIDAAEDVLFREFRAVRDAWMNFPAAYAAKIAAALDVDADKVAAILDRYVREQLNALAEPQADPGRYTRET